MPAGAPFRLRVFSVSDLPGQPGRQASAAAPELAEDEVHCWLLNERAPALPAAESFLSDSELARLEAMGDGGRAEQFAHSRFRSKSLLSAYLGAPLLSLDFQLNENGKPYLAGDPIRFNLSHTDGWIALAVARSRPVGVDLERRRSVSHLDRIARKFFAASELAALDAAPSVEAREDLFFQLWSAKEALIKGMGGGVFRNVLDTELAPGPGGMLVPRRLPGEAAESWSLTRLEVEHGVVGMLAVGPQA